MNSKERLNAAMNLEPHDQIPIMCQMSIGHMLQQLMVHQSEFWFDKNTFKNGLIKLREQYNFDGILVSLHGHNPNWRNNIDKIETSEINERVYLKNGDIVDCPNYDLPIYTYAKEKRLPQLSKLTFTDLPKILDYIPVSQNLHFYIDQKHKFDILNELVSELGNEYSIHGEITSPFDYFLDFLGLQEALIELIDNPDQCKMVLSHFTKLVEKLAEDMCETGVDAIKISSPFAGSGFISPEDYKEFVLQFEKEIATSVRNKGVHAYTHTCGMINDRLELMFESCISGIECLDPPPIGDVELKDAFQRINNKGFIKGNIDSVNTLLMSSKEEILEDLKRRIVIGKKWNGFILSTACSIAPQVPKENILLLNEAVNLWGKFT
jgi:uroporphyrinogen-III decarboxylase